jgi:hypothetical protein
MATKIITTFFTKLSVPQSGLTPTIKIWLLDPLDSTVSTLVVNDDQLDEIAGGFYRYDFVGYDPTQNYVMLVDGGALLPVNERYSIASNESFNEDIANSVFDEPSLSHVASGSFGLLINQTKADTATIIINQTTAASLIATLLKYEKNRTKIDKTAKTLTVYDDDGTTPLKVFDLKDSSGTPSIIEVCERAPQ